MNIKKEFELFFEVPDFLDFDGEAYMYYGEDPLLKKVWEDIHANWLGFKKGHKSRDEEIRELRKAVKEFLGWWSINNDTFLVVIKNLQEALKDGE